MSIATVRLSPDLRVGQLFDLLRAAIIVAALAAIVELVCRRTRNTPIAAATGLAVGLSPLFTATLSPPWEAAAFGICAAAALLAGSRFASRSGSSYALLFFSLAILLTGALLVPSLARRRGEWRLSHRCHRVAQAQSPRTMDSLNHGGRWTHVAGARHPESVAARRALRVLVVACACCLCAATALGDAHDGLRTDD